MGTKAGVTAIILGAILWYYGGTKNVSQLVNLGIAAIILGIVLTTLRGTDPKRIEKMSCEPISEFIENLRKEMKLNGNPLIIPPYQNLPRGGIFIPASKNPSIKLGLMDENLPIVKGSQRESGLLITPPPGWGILAYLEKNSGSLEKTGAGYAASVASSGLSSLGLGKVAVFEDEKKLEIYAEPLHEGPVYSDPVCAVTLLAIAKGTGSVLSIEETEKEGKRVKMIVRTIGKIEELL